MNKRLTLAALAAAALSGPAAAVTGQHDFDFFLGDWQIENRRLQHPLSSSAQWETFSATQHVEALPGGIGNFDDFTAPSWRPDYVGMSLRIFDPRTGLWSIYWLNNHDGGIDAATGALASPVVGRFQDGVGRFEAADQFEGKPVLVRYLWSDITRDSAHWEQAYSADAGKTWETNWTMQIRRVPPAPPVDMSADGYYYWHPE